MSDRPIVKICGITRIEDAHYALQSGVDYIGVNRFAKSPRYVADDTLAELSDTIPVEKRVAVLVEPDSQELEYLIALGYSIFQIHFKLDSGYIDKLPQLREQLEGKELWLAPKMPPGADFPASTLQYADKVLLDTYSPNLEGGTGKTGDWSLFKSLKDQYPQIPFILAGGLSPENVQAAIQATGAELMDFNRGVGSCPGGKGGQKVLKLFRSI